MDLLLDATYRAERDHFWFRGFRQFVAPLIQGAVAGRRDLSILDCGCGTGTNLALLEPYGRAVGIDLTMSGLAFGRANGRRRLARANAVALPFSGERFDVVTSFDVIYSLADEDEAQALTEMARVLKPGGSLIVNVAAMPILRGNHSILALERRRYTRRMLKERLERVGLRVSRLTYTNATLFPLMLTVRTAQRVTGFAERESDATAEMSTPSPVVNRALTALLTAEARLVRYVSMPFGSSLLASATKP